MSASHSALEHFITGDHGYLRGESSLTSPLASSMVLKKEQSSCKRAVTQGHEGLTFTSAPVKIWGYPSVSSVATMGCSSWVPLLVVSYH